MNLEAAPSGAVLILYAKERLITRNVAQIVKEIVKVLDSRSRRVP